MNKDLDSTQIKNIIRRRKKGFLVIFLPLFLVGLIVAFALPPIYRSEAMIRVEDQDIKEGFVQSTTEEYAEERIEKLKQEALGRSNLKKIVEKFKLYTEGNKEVSVSERIGKLKDSITLETIVSEMQSKPGGKAMSFTLAFNLSHEGRNPDIVQKVTETLANFYIEEDIKKSQRTLSATTNFVEAELERIKNEIEIQEKKISEFKEKHSRELPTDLGYNIQSITRLERELDKADLELRSLTEKIIFLESQLALVEPLSPIVVEGDKVATNPSQRLKELNIQLTELKSIYSDKHPDIKKLKKEIAELESNVQASDDSIAKVKRLGQLENELATLEAKLGSKHPDVKRLKNEIAILSQEVNNSMTDRTKRQISQEKPDNPAYISLVTQIKSIKTEIQAIQEGKRNISQSIQSYQQRIEKTPSVEKELNALTRDYDAAKNKYNEVWNELTAARVAQKVEGKQGGRRFRIASPAYLPGKPYKPNRLAIILVSFLMAIGISSLISAFQESLDDSLKTSEQLRQLTGYQVLTSISYIISDRERRAKRLKAFSLSFLIIFCIGLGLYFVNHYIIPLDAMWSIILERIKMIA